MSKSILIIDTPETCETCECKYPSYKDDCLYDCAITGKRIPICGMNYQDKPDWCPLKEIPQKKTDVYSCRNGVLGINQLSERRFADGYNACIDEILKEM